jgi:hypothetical protein
VFGEIVDSNNVLEQNVEVDIYTTLNEMKDTLVASAETTGGGYRFDVNPAPYILYAKNVCSMVTVPSGLVELSAVDAPSGLT